MRHFAVFASGAGSNFQVIAEAVRKGDIPGELVLLVCDQPKATVLAKAEALGVPTFVAAPKTYSSKAAYEEAVLDKLESYQVDFIVLAGYMRLIGATLLHAFPRKIINIHPSLLPSFPGLHAIEQALKAGVKVTGVTIHYVDAGMDTGPIIAQKAVTIETDETLDQLTEKIHNVEHQLYPQVIAELLNEE